MFGATLVQAQELLVSSSSSQLVWLQDENFDLLPPPHEHSQYASNRERVLGGNEGLVHEREHDGVGDQVLETQLEALYAQARFRKPYACIALS